MQLQPGALPNVTAAVAFVSKKYPDVARGRVRTHFCEVFGVPRRGRPKKSRKIKSPLFCDFRRRIFAPIHFRPVTSLTTMGKKMNDEDSWIGNDKLSGVQAISAFINETQRRTYYLLENGLTPGRETWCHLGRQ